MSVQEKKKGDHNIWITRVNRCLVAAAIGLSGFALTKYFSMDSNARAVPSEEIAVGREPATADILSFDPKPFSVYARGIQQRDVFKPKGEPAVPVKNRKKAAVPALGKQVKLVGILMDRDSKAIVEDLKEKETRFLSKGETIQAALIEDIQEDKVIFVYNDERIEMPL